MSDREKSVNVQQQATQMLQQQPLSLQQPVVHGGFTYNWPYVNPHNILTPWIHASPANNASLLQPVPKQLASPSSTDIQGKDTPCHIGLSSPLGIHSPKPVNADTPGYLLGSRRDTYEKGYHAFSPYASSNNSRTGTPFSCPSTTVPTGILSLSQPDKITALSHATHEVVAVDLTISKSNEVETRSKRDAGGRERKPVAHITAQPRTAQSKEHKNRNKHTDSLDKKSESGGQSTLVTQSQNTASTVSPAVPPSGWPAGAYPPAMAYPPSANPYPSYAMHPFYMMHHTSQAPRGMYPLYTAPQPPFILPDLQIPKHTVTNSTNASTSPNKPASVSGSSVAHSPKSPLDKARERLQEIEEANARKQSKNLASPLTKEQVPTFPDVKPTEEKESKQKSTNEKVAMESFDLEESSSKSHSAVCGIVSETVEYRQEEDISDTAPLSEIVQKARKARMKRKKRPIKKTVNCSDDDSDCSEIDPVTIAYDKKHYTVSHGNKDLISLESKLKLRLKTLSKQIEKHTQGVSSLSIKSSKSESQSSKRPLQLPHSHDSPVKKTKLSAGAVRSSNHPSLKAKATAAAKAARSKRQVSSSSDFEVPNSLAISIPLSSSRPECRKLLERELTTTDNLILMNIDGLFYESHIKAIDPPDIYGILVQGERHSKPRIFTQEEMLMNAYTNIRATRLSEMTLGSRVCAYWSELFGCLYPGTVTEIYPSTSSTAQHLIDIEFDDGDSGKFPLRQIRLLPSDYPHTNYDSSSVIPVSRRKSTLASTGTVSKGISSPPPPRRPSVAGTKGRGRPRKKPQVEDATESAGEVFESDNDTEEAAGMPTLEWAWSGKATRKQARGRGRRDYYQCLVRGDEKIQVGDCAVFKSVGVDSLPYIGEILSMWEGWSGNMTVSVKWFYHPQEIASLIGVSKYKCGLFVSEHVDENSAQTIKQRCEVISHEEYMKRKLHHRTHGGQSSCDIYYLAGSYDAGKAKIKKIYV